jgi:hypothetical protein
MRANLLERCNYGEVGVGAQHHLSRDEDRLSPYTFNA